MRIIFDDITQTFLRGDSFLKFINYGTDAATQIAKPRLFFTNLQLI